MDLFKPIRELFKPSPSGVHENDVTRRNFLSGLGAIAGVVIAEQVFPFRTYSFAKELHLLNVPGSLFKIGDRFSTPLGVTYEVIGVGESNPFEDSRYGLPLTIIREYDFRAQTELISRVDAMYGFSQKRDWSEPETIRQAVMQREQLKSMTRQDFNRVIHGSRKFELERNGSVNLITTKFYQGEDK